MDKEFRPVAKHKEYLINRDGVILFNYGNNKGKVKALNKRYRNGKPDYVYTVMLWENKEIDGQIVSVRCYKPTGVHRLIAQTFIPNPFGKDWVNHIDGDKFNNSIDNLEWTTISENIQHAHDTGLVIHKQGKDHWNYGKKANEETKQLMREQKLGENHPKFKGYYVVYGVKYPSANEAARQLNMVNKTISRKCYKGIEGNDFYFLPK